MNRLPLDPAPLPFTGLDLAHEWMDLHPLASIHDDPGLLQAQVPVCALTLALDGKQKI
jgi:hypothetical protein